jgi:hypothetical protein
MLTMGDAQTENRLALGHLFSSDDSKAKDTWDKWSLVFRDPSHGWTDYLDLGATTPKDGTQRTGYVLLRNSQGQRIEQLPR